MTATTERPVTDGATTPAPLPRSIAALGGLVAAGLGLGAGELVAGLRQAWRSPVVSVGDRVIDQVPPPVKDLAIEWFGTNDKVALVVGIVVILALVAAGLGLATLRQRRPGVGVTGAAAFGVVGAWAAVASPTAGWGAAVPGLVGGAVAAGAFVGLYRLTEPAPGGTGEIAAAIGPDRRRVLLVLGAGAALAATGVGVGRILRERFDVASERLALALPGARRSLPPVPTGLEAQIAGVSPLVTPNADFYRIDTALVVPAVSVDGWRLRVTGRVDRELELTYDDVLARELVETDVTIACVSNEVGGRLVGNARWLGCRLDDLLAEAGVRPEADQVIGRSVDGFTAGFPVAALDGRDAIVAVAMNGEPLPQDHGYPARLIVPGLYGYVSATKWLSSIELTRFDEVEGYWVPRGWAAEAPIKTQSRIDTPRGAVPAGTVPVAGVAWAGVRGVDRVEVRVDEGPWQEATLGPELAETTWRQWHLAWDATPGTHVLEARATDGTGDTQTARRSPPAPDGATGWHRRTVVVE